MDEWMTEADVASLAVEELARTLHRLGMRASLVSGGGVVVATFHNRDEDVVAALPADCALSMTARLNELFPAQR